MKESLHHRNTTEETMQADRMEHSAYKLGFDCGTNGANEDNCHWPIFVIPEYAIAWERGKADAEAGRPMEKRNKVYPT